MSHRVFNISIILTCLIVAPSISAADLSGCDKEEMDFLQDQLKKGFWTFEEIADHCQPGYADSESNNSSYSAVGRWSWFNGGTITLNNNGEIAGGGKKYGTYTCTGNVCSLNWDNGKYIDTLTLSPDGQKLDGKNQNGVHVWGKRVN